MPIGTEIITPDSKFEPYEPKKARTKKATVIKNEQQEILEEISAKLDALLVANNQDPVAIVRSINGHGETD